MKKQAAKAVDAKIAVWFLRQKFAPERWEFYQNAEKRVLKEGDSAVLVEFYVPGRGCDKGWVPKRAVLTAQK